MSEGGPQDIRDRALKYVVRAVEVFRYLRRKNDEAGVIFGRQFLRSAGSIGANLAEAQAGESRQDFIHKTSIAQKEARESLYWLRVIEQCGSVPARMIEPLMKETNEIVAVITAILVSAKRRK